MTIIPNTRTQLVCKFDYGWLFDHSCGHDRKRPGGLDVNGLTKEPSPKATIMRPSKIERAEGILGEYNHSKKLKVGMIQKMVFEEYDCHGNVEAGPVIWSEEKRQTKFDIVDGVTEEKKLSGELKADLESAKINLQGNKQALQN